MTFGDQTRGISHRVEIPCTTDDFSFSVPASPGTYKVTVSNNGVRPTFRTDLPPTSLLYELPDELTVEGDVSDFVIDVPSHLVKGRVTLDGALPEVTDACTDLRPAALVNFRRNVAESLAQVVASIPCDTTDFGFETRVYPGTWFMSVKNGGGVVVGYSSTLPETGEEYWSFAPLIANADQTEVELDVKGLVQVSGAVTHNGATPLLTQACTGTLPALRLHFRDTVYGNESRQTIPCDTTDFSFATSLFPGTYEVRVQNLGAAGARTTDLPDTSQEFIAIERLDVAGDTSDVVVDVKSVAVSGALTLEGAVPRITAACSTTAARIDFRPSAALPTSVEIPCTTPDFSFATRLYPGTYTVAVTSPRGPSGSPTNLPEQSGGLTVYDGLPILVDRTDLAIDVKPPPTEETVTVDGKLTLRGQKPAPTENCTTNQPAARIRFHPASGANDVLVTIGCAETFEFSVNLVPGTYDVLVSSQGTIGAIPTASGWYRVHEGLEITGNVDQLQIDLAPVRVAGTVLINGVAVEKTEACTETRNAFEVRFKDTVAGAGGSQFTFSVPCSSESLTFEGEVYPGVYEVSIRHQQHASLPRGFATTLPETIQPIVVVNALKIP